MSEQPPDAIEKFGPFQVFERLGVGGTASVFRAILPGEGGAIEVSLKRLHPHLADDERVVKEFVHEARLARLMQHENISRFFQVGRLGTEYFIATEYIAGIDLGRLLQNAHAIRTPPSISVVLSLLTQLCAALDYAHERVDDQTGEKLDFIHRDVSPSNLIVTPQGCLKLIDLGIAKARTSTIKTETGMIKGKLGYMAPEALTGEAVDRRVDIFAIGVVAWELITAVRLFGGATDADTVEKIQAGADAPPSVINPACPPHIDAIVMRALRDDPTDRWPTAGAMKRAIEDAAATLHEPLSPAVVAEWLEASTTGAPRGGEDRDSGSALLEIQVPGAGDRSAEALLMEQTTRVVARRALAPAPPARFPAGTGPQMDLGAGLDLASTALPPLPPGADGAAPLAPHAIVPASSADRFDSTAAVAPLSYEPEATAVSRSRIIAGVLGVSLFINLTLVVAVIASSDDAETAAAIGSPPVVAGAEGAKPLVPVPLLVPAPAPAPADAAPAPTPTPPAAPPKAPPAPVTAKAPAASPPAATLRRPPPRVRGSHPRSRSTTARYRARVCINRRGRVTSIALVDGPRRLERRIKRALGRWRYRPHRAGGVATAACFDVIERLRRR